MWRVALGKRLLTYLPTMVILLIACFPGEMSEYYAKLFISGGWCITGTPKELRDHFILTNVFTEYIAPRELRPVGGDL